MLRYTSQDGAELAVRHTRSLSRYSEAYLHVQSVPLNESDKYLNCHILFIVCLAYFVDGFFLTSCIPVFPNFFDAEFGPMGIGLLFALHPVVCLVSYPAAVCAVDNQGPKTPLLYGLLLLSISLGCVIYGLTLSDISVAYVFMCVAQCMHGLASPFVYVSGMALNTMSHVESCRLRAVYIISLASTLGILIGAPASGALYDYTNPYTCYALLLVPLIMDTLVFMTVYNNGHAILVSEVEDEVEIESESVSSRLLPSEWRFASKANQSICDLLSNSYILITVGCCILTGIILGFVCPYGVVYIRRQFGYSITVQGGLVGLLYLAGVIVSPITGQTSSSKYTLQLRSSKFPSRSRTLMYSGVIVTGLAMCCVVWVISVYVLAVLVGCIGIGLMCMQAPVLTLVAEIAEWQGFEISSNSCTIYELSIYVGLAIGPILGPGLQVASGGGTRGFTVACFVLGLACCLYSIPILRLRDVGKRLGEDALELDGSVYGRKSLDSIVDGYSDSMSSRSNKKSFNSSGGPEGYFLEEDSAVF